MCNSDTDTHAVCGNTTSQKVLQHEKLPNYRLQEIQQDKGTQYTDACSKTEEPQFQHQYLYLSAGMY